MLRRNVETKSRSPKRHKKLNEIKFDSIVSKSQRQSWECLLILAHKRSLFDATPPAHPPPLLPLPPFANCIRYPFHSFISLLVLRTIFVGSIPNINNIIDVPPTVSSEPRQSFVDKIHGITDKLQSLSYLGGHDSTDSKSSKSGKFLAWPDSGKRNFILLFFLDFFVSCIQCNYKVVRDVHTKGERWSDTSWHTTLFPIPPLITMATTTVKFLYFGIYFTILCLWGNLEAAQSAQFAQERWKSIHLNDALSAHVTDT